MRVLYSGERRGHVIARRRGRVYTHARRRGGTWVVRLPMYAEAGTVSFRNLLTPSAGTPSDAV